MELEHEFDIEPQNELQHELQHEPDPSEMDLSYVSFESLKKGNFPSNSYIQGIIHLANPRDGTRLEFILQDILSISLLINRFFLSISISISIFYFLAIFSLTSLNPKNPTLYLFVRLQNHLSWQLENFMTPKAQVTIGANNLQLIQHTPQLEEMEYMLIVEEKCPVFLKVNFESLLGQLSQFVYISKEGLLVAGVPKSFLERSSNPGPSPEKKHKSYPPFARLAELEEQAIIKNQKAETFFAIVLEFLPPTQTKNDMLTKFYVVDPSRKKPAMALFFHFLNTSPLIREPGEVVKFINFVPSIWKENLQLGGNKKTSSILIFDSKIDSPVIPRSYPGDRRKHDVSESDKEIVQNFRRWWKDNCKQYLNPNLQNNKSLQTSPAQNSLNSLSSPNSSNSSNLSPSKNVQIQNGDQKPANLMTLSQLNSTKPLFSLIAQLFRLENRSNLPMTKIWVFDKTENENIQEHDQLYGSIFPIEFWDENSIKIQSLVASFGDIILFNQLELKTSKKTGCFEGVVRGNSRPVLTKLSSDSPLVQDLIRRKIFPESVQSPPVNKNLPISLPQYGIQNSPSLEPKSSNFPLTKTLTNPGITMTSLADIRNFPKLLYKFLCNCFVYDYHPTNIRDFTRAYCQNCDRSLTSPKNYTTCPHCSFVSNKPFPFRYTVQLFLEDDTAYLTVILFGKDAEDFFHGIPPTNLYENNISLKILEAKMHALCASPGFKNNNRLTTNFCIKSYVAKTGDEKQDRYFRIFDTVLL